jgi:hypothetical protein
MGDKQVRRVPVVDQAGAPRRHHRDGRHRPRDGRRTRDRRSARGDLERQRILE